MSTISSIKKDKLGLKRNDRLISLSSANSKSKTVSMRLNNTEKSLSLQDQFNKNKICNLNHAEMKSNLTQSPLHTTESSLTINNLLNNIKRSILVHKQETITDSGAKYSSNILLTSPYVSQGLKNKYSQIYLETMNTINANEQKNLLLNNALTNLSGPNANITKKKEELMVLLNSDSIISNKQNLKPLNESPINQVKKIPLQSNYLSGYNEIKQSNFFTPSPKSKQKIMKFIKTKPITLTNSNDEVSKCINKLRHKGEGYNHNNSNSYRIIKAQSKFEKIMDNSHKAIVFTNRIVKKPPLPKKNPSVVTEDITAFMNGLQANYNSNKL